MGQLTASDRGSADQLALQADVVRAGCAWACPFASSEEFEAAIIKSKRQAGAFGQMRRRYMLYAGATTGMLAALALVT